MWDWFTDAVAFVVVACFLAVVLSHCSGSEADAVPVSHQGPTITAPRDGRHTRATYYTGATGACGPLTGHYAASKFYACGAKVQVVHRHKTVTVTIQDRCQCFIDLAKGAFAKLAPTSKGVIGVRLYKKGSR